tara:strand:- start:2024 stop:2242 length:219 start_codon:yes stop_codon:yes gene_type:complete
MNKQLTTQEQSLINQLVLSGAETIKGIPFNSTEVGLIDLCNGAMAFGLTSIFETAYSALIKLNPMGQVIFTK